MNRYQAFNGSTYYPSPGWRDWVGSADTLAEAERMAKASRDDWAFNWWQVVDMKIEEVVAGEGIGYGGCKINAGP